MVVPVSLALMVLSLAATGLASGYSDKDAQLVVTTLYKRLSAEKGELVNVSDPTLLKNSLFNPLEPTKIIVHGWLSGQNKQKGNGGPLLKDALLEVSDYNIILVDWSGVDSINYIGSRAHVKPLGELVGALIEQLVQVGGMEHSDLQLIGHSLGAHIMGYAGRSVKLGNKGRITALDPAGPLFWNDPNVRLDKTDAGFVEVIHTCGGLIGYKDPIGHVDFYPNGGTWIQPGCGVDPGSCSHCRSYSLLLESIEVPDSFIGTKCNSWSDYKNGKCKDNETAGLGLGTDQRARGSFYFKTNDIPPYSQTAGIPASARLNSTKNFMHC